MRPSKTLLSFSLMALLSLPSYASDLFDGYQSGAAPQKWTDGNGGKYYYGGEMTYRFKRTSPYKDIVEVRPPGIKAGCNGISISGGFFHLLGLDDIKDQLSSASQGAAMGVLVGIVYSMPGLGDAFDKVHNYLRMFQGLMSNSCQNSAAATRQAITNLRAQYNSDPSKMGPVESAIGGFYSGLWSSADGAKKMIDGGADGVVEQVKNLPIFTKQTQGVALKAAKANLSLGSTGKAFIIGNETNIKTFVDANAQTLPSGVKAPFAESTLSDLSRIINNEEKLNAAMFTFVFMGYEALSYEHMPKADDVNETVIAEDIQKTMYGTGFSGGEPVYNRPLYTSTTNTADLANTLMYGNGTGNITIKNIKVVPYYYAPKATSTSASSDSEIKGILFGLAEETTQTMSYPWKGFFNEGYEYMENTIFGDGTRRPTIPAAFPNMRTYIDTLKMMRKTDNEAYIRSLMSMLAKKNAVMLLQSVVFEMQAHMKEGTTKDDQDIIRAQVDQIYKTLEHLNTSDASINDTIAIFERIERDHKANVARGTSFLQKN